jgi:hypothetical protein
LRIRNGTVNVALPEPAPWQVAHGGGIYTLRAIQRAKLEGFEIAISELETEMDYLRRATRYLEE